MSKSHGSVWPNALGGLVLLIGAARLAGGQANWSLLTSSGPSARDQAAACYHSSRNETVMFGGQTDGGSPLSDTWVWNGISWTQRYIGEPTGRAAAAMAYDSGRNRVVLFGGYNSFSTALHETWEWDGTSWGQYTWPTYPSARFSTAMAYDAARSQIVLFGGWEGGPTRYNDTWVFDGAHWDQKNPATSPPGRFGHCMVYDSRRHEVVLFGGADFSIYNDTWVWSGTTWTQKSPASSPPARYYAAMVYDEAAGEVVLFGGLAGSGSLADTWVWDGSTWSQKTPAASPTARYSSAAAYDGPGAQVLLCGGFAGSARTAQTWGWQIPPVIQTQPASQTVVNGQSAYLNVAASGTPALTYQWYQGVSGDTSAPMATATGSSFVTPALTTDTSFWVRVANGRGSTDSATAAITIVGGCEAPQITLQPMGGAVAPGTIMPLWFAAAGTAPLSYQWYQGTSGDTSAPIAGATGTYFETPRLYSTTSYWARTTNPCGLADTDTTTLFVDAGGPVITLIKSKTSKPGSKATIYGSGFSASSKGNVVYFGTKKAKISKAKTTSLKVTIPKRTPKGPANVTVATGGATSNVYTIVIK